MDLINSNRYKKILGIITITKFSSILFVLLIILNKLFSVSDILNHEALNSYLIMYVLFISVSLIIIISFWSFSYLYMFRSIKLISMVEDIIFIVMLFILILCSNTYQSNYKYLFLFGVISATISANKKHGLTVAYVSSVIILSIDLFFSPKLIVNIYFENDILLSLAFIMIAWFLGEYKKFEGDQREVLESELKEQLKEHENMEDMLLKNDVCYNLLIEQSHYAIMLHCNDKLLYINENALQLIGTTSVEQVATGNTINYKYSQNKESLKERYLDIMNNQMSNISFEEKIINIQAEVINIQNTSTYCIYGKSPAILTIMRDITPEKQVEKLQEDMEKNIKLLNDIKEQNEFITEFFSNISHELKTPLNVIFSSLQLIIMYNERSEEEFINKRKYYLNIMKQNCYRLIRLINNLLDMTKYEAGFITLQLENQNIISAVEDIAQSILPYAINKGINVIFDTNVEEKIIAFDMNKIERIVLNLLSNALKFTNRGGVIYVNTIDKGDEVEISVRDTGIGIPEDKKELIFGRFMQIDKTLKRNNEGSGIGLSLVKSFVEMHGGKIRLESKLEEGSEFIITLPAIRIKKAVKITEMKEEVTERVNMELSDIYTDEPINN